MLQLGPQVVIVDDKPEEIYSVQETLDSLHVGNTFFKVDFTEPKYPEKPIDTVQLLFLDLHYNTNYGSDFDPYACIEWINKIVPKGKDYILVVWTRDPERSAELDELMQHEDVTYPTQYETKSKPDYQIGDTEYAIRKILDEVGIEYIEYTEYEDIINAYEILGQIISKEDDSILINCLINQDPKVFEVRRFDSELFNDFTELKADNFVKIVVTTKSGSKKFDFLPEPEDLSELFIRSDPFSNFKDFDLLSD